MNLKIEMHRIHKSFKSGLAADNLNNFVVLTGKNGVGKSQLLQLLALKEIYLDPQFKKQPVMLATATIDEEILDTEEILSIFDWNLGAAASGGMSEIQAEKNNVISFVQSYINGQPDQINSLPKFQREELIKIVHELIHEGSSPLNPPKGTDITSRLSADYFKSTHQVLNERIASVIYEWNFDNATIPGGRKGANPIDVFNRLCEDFELKYSLPQITDLKTPYYPHLINPVGDRVDWGELSSGEKVLMRIICWLFYVNVYQRLYPKLILLDEPDAHLSPRMIRKLIASIQEVIVNKMNISVLMTTHSPNTVALCEEEALYELVEDGIDRVVTKITRNEAINKFSEGLLFVQEDTRLIFIEGKDDVGFYEMFYRSAMLHHGLSNIPSMKFIAASVADPGAGGVKEVYKMVERFKDTSIESLIFGIVDKDSKNEESGHVLTLSRYSIENYIYDPFILAIALLMRDEHLGLTSISHLVSWDYKPLLLDSALRQAAVDEIVSKLKSFLTSKEVVASLDETSVSCSWFVKGIDSEVSYELPSWFLDMQKNSLRPLFHEKKSPFRFSSNGEEAQKVVIRSLYAIPGDIHSILASIQGGTKQEVE